MHTYIVKNQDAFHFSYCIIIFSSSDLWRMAAFNIEKPSFVVHQDVDVLAVQDFQEM